MTPKKRSPAKKAEVAVRSDGPVKVASQRVDGGPGTALAVRAGEPMGATEGTHDIQTTMQPWKTITVGEAEYESLLAQGLVYSGDPVTPAADAYDLLFADKVENGTATPAALRAAYAAAGLPSYAGAHPGRFDPRTSGYNWKASNTRRLRASLAKAQAGTGLANHLFVGDSETDKFVGTGYDQLHMWPRILRSTLASLGVPVGGTGFIRASSTVGGQAAADPRWAFTGTWTFGSAVYVQASSTAATATFTPTDAGTTLQLAFMGTSAAFSVTVDGSAPASGSVTLTAGTYSAGAVTPAGGLSVQKLTVTGLSNAVHTLIVTTSNASSVYIIGADLYGASGLLIHNVAAYGSTAQQWATSATGNATTNLPGLTGALNATPDVVWIALGVNDINGGGRTPAQVVTDLTTIAGYFPSSDVLLVGQYQPNGTTLANWQAYIAALYGLADTLDVPLLDLLDRSGGYTAANANGLMGDVTHPNVAGQASWGRAAALLAAG